MSLKAVPLCDARTGAAPARATAVRVGFRDGALVVRFDGRDEGTVATLRGRDDPLWTEDVYEVFLSPLDPPTTYFEFEINPLGALFDARVESPDLVRGTMRVDAAWNLPGLRARSIVRPGRWSASLAIPLEALLTDTVVPHLWRANFYRIDRGATDEFTAWSPPFCDPPDFHRADRFGALELP